MGEDDEDEEEGSSLKRKRKNPKNKKMKKVEKKRMDDRSKLRKKLKSKKTKAKKLMPGRQGQGGGCSLEMKSKTVLILTYPVQTTRNFYTYISIGYFTTNKLVIVCP